jgi:proteasome lid subunit RPN8/RPN11
VSTGVVLALSPDLQSALWRHLLPDGKQPEQAAFGCVVQEPTDGRDIFRCLEWHPVPAEGFTSRSAFHFELTDEVRAGAIKRAHDLGASLVEFHSHTGPWPAAFSPSDFAGFRDFVPHVWWRLKGRPYFAVVVTRSGFDGLAWLAAPRAPEPLGGILVGESLLMPTGLSHWGPATDD